MSTITSVSESTYVKISSRINLTDGTRHCNRKLDVIEAKKNFFFKSSQRVEFDEDIDG
jgi:hypothetical protein